MKQVVIVGGGIAGQTAAIYASRKKMDYLLIAKQLGGQVYQSGEILNYPGIPRTTGAEFGERLEKHLQELGVEPREGEEVKRVEPVAGGYRIVSDGGEYLSRTVIVATGARPRRLEVPGEERLVNRGVAYCSICDGPLFADQTIAIVGGGNSALEGVDSTHAIAKKVYVLNIEEEFIAHETLMEKARTYRNVELIAPARTVEILGDKEVEGLKYEKDGGVHTLKLQGVIVEIGREPVVEFLDGLVELDQSGHIKIDCQTRTSRPGVFAAGDCAAGHEYQYVIAAGQGCLALLKASRYLADTSFEDGDS